MKYNLEIHQKCQEEITKHSKKNQVLKKALTKKIEEILENPTHYKPLKPPLARQRRVHIMKSFVLRYEIDEENKIVKLLAFSHHDEAYKK